MWGMKPVMASWRKRISSSTRGSLIKHGGMVKTRGCKSAADKVWCAFQHVFGVLVMKRAYRWVPGVQSRTNRLYYCCTVTTPRVSEATPAILKLTGGRVRSCARVATFRKPWWKEGKGAFALPPDPVDWAPSNCVCSFLKCLCCYWQGVRLCVTEAFDRSLWQDPRYSRCLWSGHVLNDIKKETQGSYVSQSLI